MKIRYTNSYYEVEYTYQKCDDGSPMVRKRRKFFSEYDAYEFVLLMDKQDNEPVLTRVQNAHIYE